MLGGPLFPSKTDQRKAFVHIWAFFLHPPEVMAAVTLRSIAWHSSVCRSNEPHFIGGFQVSAFAGGGGSPYREDTTSATVPGALISDGRLSLLSATDLLASPTPRDPRVLSSLATKVKQELQIKANNILHYLDNWLCSKSLHIVLCHTATDRFSLSFWNLPLPLYVCTFQLLKGPTSKSGLARAPPRRSHAPPATGTTAGYGFSFLRPVDLSAAHFYKAFPCQMCFCHRFHSCGIGSPSKNWPEWNWSSV